MEWTDYDECASRTRCLDQQEQAKLSVSSKVGVVILAVLLTPWIVFLAVPVLAALCVGTLVFVTMESYWEAIIIGLIVGVTGAYGWTLIFNILDILQRQ